MGNLSATTLIVLATFLLACKQGRKSSNNPITKELLTSHKWELNVSKSCINSLDFQDNLNGITYDCEINLRSDFRYKIAKDTLFIDEFNIPTEDNSAQKVILQWSGKFIYTGQSLKLVSAKLYDKFGITKEADLSEILEYHQK